MASETLSIKEGHLAGMKPLRNKEYLHWCARQLGECCLCDSPAVDLHHFGSQGGMGMKGSDYWIARVCRDCHARVQGKRRLAFMRNGDLETYVCLLEDALELAERWIDDN
jgi:hypothetical protein